MALLLSPRLPRPGGRTAGGLLPLLLLLATLPAASLSTAASLTAQDTTDVEPPALRGPGALARSLDAALDDPALARAHVGMAVRSAETGELIYGRAAHRRFTTASTAKVVTAAVALERLGPGFRWTTRLAACGPVDRDGALDGDLVITGSGDPTVDRGRLTAWADTLRAAGIRRIEGDVVADDRAFPPPIWGRGWMWDDLHLGWASGVDALQLDEPAVEVVLRPGARVGDPVRAEVREAAGGGEASPRPPVDLRVRTGPAGSELRLRHRPGPAPGPAGRIVGWLPADRDSVRLSLAPAHPTGRLLDELAAVLAGDGPAVEGSFRRRPEADAGEARSRPPDAAGSRTGGRAGGERPPGEPAEGEAADPCPPGAAPPSWTASSRSDSLGAVLGPVLARSDNQAAEALLRTLGLVEGRAGTAREGAAVASETLAGWGVGPDAVTLADGAGLSRYDRATPAALTRVLRATWLGPHRDVLLDALAAPGRAGTLHGRFRGVPARASLRAKTGSLSEVRALAGFVEADDGQTLAFALMIDGYHVPGRVAEALRDRVVERLGLYRGRERRRPEGGAPEDAR